MIIGKPGPTFPFPPAEFEICTRINPISFKGSSIISTLCEWLCARVYADSAIDREGKRERERERERGTEMLATNELELELNGVLSGRDLLKIGAYASMRVEGPPEFARWVPG